MYLSRFLYLSVFRRTVKGDLFDNYRNLQHIAHSLDWFIHSTPEGNKVQHNGGTGGSRSSLQCFPQLNAGFVILTNSLANRNKLEKDPGCDRGGTGQTCKITTDARTGFSTIHYESSIAHFMVSVRHFSLSVSKIRSNVAEYISKVNYACLKTMI